MRDFAAGGNAVAQFVRFKMLKSLLPYKFMQNRAEFSQAVY